MKDINPYLLFNGDCREAMTMYARCFDAELELSTYGQTGGPPEKPGNDLIMHARLAKGKIVLMASDCPPDRPIQKGNNFSISIDCESMEEIQSLFSQFSQGATITMPLQDTFWGAHFGMLTDRFGTNWMFNFDKKAQ